MLYDAGMSHRIHSIADFAYDPKGGYLFGVTRPAIKQLLLKEFQEAGALKREHFVSLSHPFGSTASTAALAGANYLEPGVVISPYTRLGFGVTVSRGSTIGHHTEIQDFSSINPGVTIAGHGKVGEAVVIGVGAVVFDHVEIGAGSIIGGGSVVTKDIPAGVVAYGNPCKVVRKI